MSTSTPITPLRLCAERAAHAGGLEIVRVSTPLDFAQAALVLGEQRAWLESLLGSDLALAQPDSTCEYAHLDDYYRPPDGRLLLARVDGEPVGVAGVRRREGARAEGKRLYVRSSARGLGVGRRLALELIEAARDLGFASLYIETAPAHMSAAYELYLELGFRETVKEGFLDRDDAVALELRLDAARPEAA
jgi:GNAT superfamily N-acetyltransferase